MVLGLPGITATAFTNSSRRSADGVRFSVIVVCIVFSSSCALNVGRLNPFATLLNQFGHQPSPAGLVTRPDPSSVVSVKIFVKLNEVAPVGVALKLFESTVDGASAFL